MIPPLPPALAAAYSPDNYRSATETQDKNGKNWKQEAQLGRISSMVFDKMPEICRKYLLNADPSAQIGRMMFIMGNCLIYYNLFI